MTGNENIIDDRLRSAFGIADVKAELISLMVGLSMPTCLSCMVGMPKNWFNKVGKTDVI